MPPDVSELLHACRMDGAYDVLCRNEHTTDEGDNDNDVDLSVQGPYSHGGERCNLAARCSLLAG